MVPAPMEKLNHEASLLQAVHVIHCVNADVIVLAEGAFSVHRVGDRKS
jgi:hypothetical protein